MLLRLQSDRPRRAARMSGMGEGGGLFPSAIVFKSQGQAELRNVAAAIEDLNRDMGRDIADSTDAKARSLYSSFRSMRAEWKKFYDEHYDQVFGWGGTFDAAQDYRKKLGSYSSQFRALGGSTTGAAIPPPTVTPHNPLEMFGLKIPPALLYVVGGLVALAVVGPVVAPAIGSLLAARRARRPNPRRRRRRLAA